MRSISEAKVISRVRRKTNYKKIVFFLILIFILQFAAVESLIIVNGKSDEEIKTDYLIILGAGINGDALTLSLHNRLVAGLEYLKKYPDTYVVVAGGQGRGEDVTEAEVMKKFLVDNGIEADKILMETNSTSTMENFKFSKKLMEQKSGKPVTDITFVTNSFHVLRSKMLAERNGFNAYAISCETPGQVAVRMYVREYFALVKSFLLDR